LMSTNRKTRDAAQRLFHFAENLPIATSTRF
jgi:hypothetical protein